MPNQYKSLKVSESVAHSILSTITDLKTAGHGRDVTSTDAIIAGLFKLVIALNKALLAVENPHPEAFALIMSVLEAVIKDPSNWDLLDSVVKN